MRCIFLRRIYLPPSQHTCVRSDLCHDRTQNRVKSDHIEVTTIKTGDSVSIKLNKTNQAMNRSIKDLCQLAGINELIRITTYKGNVRKDEAMAKFDTLL